MRGGPRSGQDQGNPAKAGHEAMAVEWVCLCVFTRMGVQCSLRDLGSQLKEGSERYVPFVG